MIVLYSANGEPGQITLPSAYLDFARAEDLAELVASDFWRHSGRSASPVTLIHLQDVDGTDLGRFEVRSQMRAVFTATSLAGRG